MGDLERIASAKIEARTVALLDSLPPRIMAIKQQHAPQGIGGNTLWAIAQAGAAAVESLKDSVQEQYSWVFSKSWLLSQSRGRKMIDVAAQSLTPIFERAVQLATHEANAMHAENAIPQLRAEIEGRHSHAVQDLRLSLAAALEEHRRHRIATALGAPLAFILKLFRGGPG